MENTEKTEKNSQCFDRLSPELYDNTYEVQVEQGAEDVSIGSRLNCMIMFVVIFKNTIVDCLFR